MIEINLSKWSKKKMIFAGLTLVFILILLLGGYVAYQYFVLKKSLEVQLLLLSSQRTQNVLLSALASILIIVAGILAYFKFKNFSLTSLQKKSIVLRAVILTLIIASLVGGYFSYQYYLVKKEFGPQLAAQQETRELVAAVGKLMLLPTNETPTIATVTDITKLKDQQFFSKAKNGDKILIYANAKEAILYSHSLNIILGVAPVTIGGGQAPSQATQAKIALRNGTDSLGLTYKVEADIQKAFPGANIVLKDQAQNNQYAKTIVISLNDVAKGASQDLARKLNATVSTLPQGEPTPPGVDILVIVGKDKL